MLILFDHGTPTCHLSSAPREKERAERFLTSAGRPFHRSERGRKSRPAPFGMTEGVGANGPGIRAWVVPLPAVRRERRSWYK